MKEDDKKAMVEFQHVSKRYDGPSGGTTALNDISFAAYPGEMVLLLGPSGSGKTTFLTIMAGLQSSSEGTVKIFGKELTSYSRGELQKIRANEIGFVFQTFLLIESLTVIQNIMLAERFVGVKKDTARNEALKILKKLGIEKLAHVLPTKISQGEKQRVAVARALINDAKLIFADEPTGSLASKQGFEIVEILNNAVINEKKCVIITSHDERITHYADRIYRLNDGELQEVKQITEKS
jgi:putative ABC transport system ATP-binding protein